jgi:hypothetical protein
MPRVSQHIIDSVFFLYPNRESAQAGTGPGGTGFVASHYFKHDGKSFRQLYGVTAWHVAVRGGSSVIRFSQAYLGSNILELAPDDWEFEPGGPDLAVIPLGEPHLPSTPAVPSDEFVSQQHRLTVGDDVFMLGLFVDHAGKATNTPAARFGNISMLATPDAPIEQPTKYNGQSFIVDLHSRTGFSGSPVYVYRTPLGDLSPAPTLRASVKISQLERQLSARALIGAGHSQDLDLTMRVSGSLLQLLGVHWMQFPERWELEHSDTGDTESVREARRAYVKGMSGMTCVIPAWEILRVLERPKLRDAREQSAKLQLSSGQGDVGGAKV